MDDQAFDQALVAAAMRLAAERGWHQVSVAEAARAAELPLPRARARFPGRHHILLALGRMADQAALSDPAPEGSARDRLFDVLMRRIDVFQAQRDGVLALMRGLPLDPAMAALLACATERSMGWMLEAAGIPASGLRGALRRRGLAAVWLWTMRAWREDVSEDLSATMAALDTALARAEPMARWLDGVSRARAEAETGTDAGTGEGDEAAAPEHD